jgi:hypothetical protein
VSLTVAIKQDTPSWERGLCLRCACSSLFPAGVTDQVERKQESLTVVLLNEQVVFLEKLQLTRVHRACLFFLASVACPYAYASQHRWCRLRSIQSFLCHGYIGRRYMIMGCVR